MSQHLTVANEQHSAKCPVRIGKAAPPLALTTMLTVLGSGTGATLGVAAASGGHLGVGAIVTLTLVGAAVGYAYALCRARLLGAPVTEVSGSTR